MATLQNTETVSLTDSRGRFESTYQTLFDFSSLTSPSGHSVIVTWCFLDVRPCTLIRLYPLHEGKLVYLCTSYSCSDSTPWNPSDTLNFNDPTAREIWVVTAARLHEADKKWLINKKLESDNSNGSNKPNHRLVNNRCMRLDPQAESGQTII